MPASVVSKASLFSSSSNKKSKDLLLIKSNQNLLGKWKLIPSLSDFYPSSSILDENSLSLRITGEEESLVIEKKKEYELEEVSLTIYNKNNLVHQKKFQIGVLNYDSIQPEVTLSLVKGCSENFSEFTIQVYGPEPGSSCSEKFMVDPISGILRILMEVVNSNGVKFTLIKHFEREEKAPLPNTPFFETSQQSKGWQLYESFPSSGLDLVKLKIVQVNETKMQTANAKSKLKEVIWKHGLINEGKLTLTEEMTNNLSRYLHFSGENMEESKEVIEFIIHVQCNNSSWFVAHRYREFNALKKFIVSHSPSIKEFRDLEQKFPRKTFGIFNHSVAEKRVSLLEAFLMGCMVNIKLSKSTVFDVFCSFLGIPNNLYRIIEDDETLSSGPSNLSENLSSFSPKSNTSHSLKFQNSRIGKAQSVQLTSSSSLSSNTDSSSSKSKKTILASLEEDPAGRASEFLPEWKEGLIRFIGQGLQIKKHGRSGSAKSRKFLIDDYASSFIIGEKDHQKLVGFEEIISFYHGYNPDFTILTHQMKRQLLDQFNNKFPSYNEFKESGKKVNGLEFGSSVLRRSCKPSEFSCCIVLVLKDRTLDLQFPSERHAEIIINNLTKGFQKKNLAIVNTPKENLNLGSPVKTDSVAKK